MIFFSQKYLQNIQPLHNIFEPKVRISSRTRIFQQKNVNRSCDTATLSDQPCKYDLTFVGLWECGLHGAVFVRSPTWVGAPPLLAQGRVQSQKSVKKIVLIFAKTHPPPPSSAQVLVFSYNSKWLPSPTCSIPLLENSLTFQNGRSATRAPSPFCSEH